MNSLILISPSLVRGFQPIISGKMENFIATNLAYRVGKKHFFVVRIESIIEQ
jgi:hypothetical protein